MKKVMLFFLCILADCSSQKLESTAVELEDSRVYSKSEIQQGVRVIEQKFSEEFESGRITKLHYKDEYIEKINECSDEKSCMVFRAEMEFPNRDSNHEQNAKDRFDNWYWYLTYDTAENRWGVSNYGFN